MTYVVQVVMTNHADFEEVVGEIEFDSEDAQIAFAKALEIALNGATDED